MRISRFELSAFGPFTEAEFSFSPEPTDFHVIFGPNEAGKSSCLRALKAWLFGFPERTRDDFLHPRTRLLVGGELVDGEKTLRFYRRKKRKGSMVDKENKPLDPGLLTPFLGGLDQDMFEVLYGIDHEALVQGGKDILARKGEIGEALFSAGAGLHTIHRVLEELERKRDELFRYKGKNQLINKGIRRHNELKKKIRDLSLVPEQWQEQADRLEKLEREIGELVELRAQRDRELQRLERLQRAIPLFARQKAAREQQQTLGAYRPLPVDFSEQRIQVQERIRQAARNLELRGIRRARIGEKLGALSSPSNILARSVQIEELFQRLGEYRKAQKDRPRLEGMRAVKLKEADSLLQMYLPGRSLKEHDTLLPLLSRKRRITELLADRTALVQAEKSGNKRLGDGRAQLEQIKEKLSRLPDPVNGNPLKQVVRRARKVGDLDQQIRDLADVLSRQQNALELRLNQLGYLRVPIAELIHCELPLAGTINLFQEELQELQQQAAQLGDREAEVRNSLAEVAARRRELVYGGKPPSESELMQLRNRRDQGFELLCRGCIRGEDIRKEAADFAGESPLHESVSELIRGADELSDRLRREAKRVHAFAAVRAEEETLAKRFAEITTLQQENQAALDLHHRSWAALWKPLGITPGTPQEMARWRMEMGQLQQQALELNELKAQQTRMKNERKVICSELRSLLPRGATPPTEDNLLAPLLTAAEDLLETWRNQEEIRQQLYHEQEKQQQIVSSIQEELDQLAAEQNNWQHEWNLVARMPDSRDPFSPEEARDLIESMQQIRTTMKEVGELESRLRGIDRDARDFEREAAQLAEETAPDLADEPAVLITEELLARLTRAGREQTLRHQYQQELEELDEEIQANRTELNNGRQELQELLELARCSDEKELARIEQETLEHRKLRAVLAEIDQDLQQIAGKNSIEELREQLNKIDEDGLPGKIHALEQEINQEIDPALRELLERKGEARQRLAQMDGSAQAAQTAEALESNLARLREHAEEYLRLQLGATMLREEMERFRRQNQDPVLTLGSSFFSRLTLGSFSGLRTDLNERGEPVLVGIRKENGPGIGVEAMSTGTRDQLYLALRLASLRHRAAGGNTLPFIVDDILINFDDERTAATLELLAELGTTGQLILFTHQGRVADQARELAGVQVHFLK